jgi:ligand-binding SRPBCC domain-containing protein
MSTVVLSTELPISAERAAALARKPELMQFVLAPVLKLPTLTAPDRLEVGTRASARLWWFGVIPAWTHHLEIKELDDLTIYTHERGGPVHTWNHRLSFTPVDEHRCRYTDEIETDDGIKGLGTRLFIRLMFRHRHRRWRTLAAVLG